MNSITSNQQKSGVYFGERKGIASTLWKLAGADCSVVKSSDEDGHIAVCGGSGSGKSSAIVIPTLCQTWKAPFVAIDIKGDLKANYDKRNPGRDAKVFSLRGNGGSTYDPLEFIRQDGGENLVANVQELVNALLPLPIDVKDPIWIASARGILTAAILYYFDLGVEFIDTVMAIMSTPPNELIQKIYKSSNRVAKIFINNFINDSVLEDSKFLMSIMQEIKNRLSIFVTDPRVCDALVPSENQIRWTDLETGSVFLSVPEDRLEQYSPVLTMMLTQLVRTLERRPEKHSPNGKLQAPILLMLEEFPKLGKMEVITSAISTLRSKNVTICLVFQSLAQLDMIYGAAARKVLLDNCSYKAVLRVGDAESQQYFSNLVGTGTVQQRSRSTSYDVNGQTTGHGENVSCSRESMIYPHKFATMEDIVLLTSKGTTCIKKVPCYKTSFTTKIRDSITKIFRKIRSLFTRHKTARTRAFDHQSGGIRYV